MIKLFTDINNLYNVSSEIEDTIYKEINEFPESIFYDELKGEDLIEVSYVDSNYDIKKIQFMRRYNNLDYKKIYPKILKIIETFIGNDYSDCRVIVGKEYMVINYLNETDNYLLIKEGVALAKRSIELDDISQRNNELSKILTGDYKIINIL
jgi:hypothetical protein